MGLFSWDLDRETAFSPIKPSKSTMVWRPALRVGFSRTGATGARFTIASQIIVVYQLYGLTDAEIELVEGMPQSGAAQT